MSLIDWTERRDGRDKSKDHRTPYERDFARVVHSAAFRRLQSKTQVLGVGDSDFYRTRLTHSLEVSQIGASITKKLYRELQEDDGRREIMPHPTLIATICLAHDLGHPPFGHGGEVSLNRCMRPFGGFEGNGQTLRIVTKLEPYHERCGMNLTRRAVLGIIKYPAPYSEVVNWNLFPEGKPVPIAVEKRGSAIGLDSLSTNFVANDYKPPKCYLDDEHKDIVLGWIAKDIGGWDKFSEVVLGENGKHNRTIYKTLDTSIMELADDIAYGVHDMEDAIGLGIITADSLSTWLDSEDEKSGKRRADLLGPILRKLHRGSISTFLDRLFHKGTQSRKRVVGGLVGFFVENAILKELSEVDWDMGLFRWNVTLGKAERVALDTLQAAVVALVIKTPQVQQLEFKGQRIVTELFNAFATDPKRLLDPRDYAKTVQGGGKLPTPRVICDYIAGMTDDYARRRYQQLFEPRSGTVFDRL
ncbi:MAG TPA: anti-phage deoxyguanosine triphosphatase [Defluviicoccus sp.]|nr:anti-phage deoxyguanosine triphosphatase [Defluviicoccus sp.]